MPDAALALADTLQAPLPDEFESLPDAELAELDSLLKAAVEQRSRDLGEAITASLGYVPRLVRPAVKRALGL